MGICRPFTFACHVWAAAKRVVWLYIVLIPIGGALVIVAILEILSTIHRALNSSYGKKKHAKSPLRFFPPTDKGAWLSWVTSSFIKRWLHRNIPLVALAARWVATRCPNFAKKPWMSRLWSLLREEETFELASRIGGRMPADEKVLEHVHSCLERALGSGWQQAMRLDPVAMSSDCVVESYSAVLREDSLAESQQARKAEMALSISAAALYCCRRRRKPNAHSPAIAETELARRAIVRVRRKDVAKTCFVDIWLIEILMSAFWLLGLCTARNRNALNEFVGFVKDQLDLRNEARSLSLCHDMPRGSISVAPGETQDESSHSAIVFPKIYGEAAAEVLIVSLEEGLCMAEALHRRSNHLVDEADAVARAAVAQELARSFWDAIFNGDLLLGGLSTSNLLLRSSRYENALEIVVLRSGLMQKIDEQTREDLRAFAQALANGPGESIGALILERVHSPAGGAFGAIRGLDAFSAGVREILSLAHAQIGPRSLTRSTLTSQPPLRGDALLQRALELAEKHGVCVGPRHLQLAAAIAAVHGVCARLDSHSAGRLLCELQVAAGTSSLANNQS